jgi:acetyltransferase-like isoleucine patch superfamily enzyme
MHTVKAAVRDQPIFGRGIRIGRDCWLGAKTTILDGSDLADGTVLGAAALIAGKKTKKNGVYLGIPAQLVRFR